MKRRDFLRTAGTFVAAAGVGIGTSACGDDGAAEGTFSFPQGVASGDPRASSVMVWTRAVRSNGSADSVRVVAEISDAEDFSNIVAEQEMTVTADSDHTLRLLVTGLSAGTRYFYRFTAGADSISGQTRTAPEASDAAPVRFAWVSCQDYEAGTYGAYRQLLDDDEAAPAADKIQFVVHLGDFIYETSGADFQRALDDDFEFFDLRAIEAFPDGPKHATTLADYRHLYKQYLLDPDLQAARARWPFIQTWDDHEFSNDNWQTQANYEEEDSLDEPSQRRKVASNQAWFEYVPCNLGEAEGVDGVAPRASDFSPADVEDAEYGEADADDEGFITEPNSADAIATMTIYRSFRWGKNIELVITDERSYRSDHPIPEELTFNNFLFFDPRNALPLDMVNTLDAGSTANGGSPPATVQGLPNPRTASPPGTMLGAEQKQWWKDTMMASDASWKIWGNEVPLMRIMAKNEPSGILITDRIMNGDAWDSYNNERKELMAFLRDNSIDNVVVITGDIHAHFVGHVYDDHDDTVSPQPVVAEFVTAGISSNSLFSFLVLATREQPAQLQRLISYDSTMLGGTDRFANNANVLFIHGTASAIEAASSNSIPAIEAAKDLEVNPHLRFVDTNAQGYGLMTVTSSEITATLVTVNRPIDGAAMPGIKGTATFTLQKDDLASLDGPVFTGEKPFPFT